MVLSGIRVGKKEKRVESVELQTGCLNHFLPALALGGQEARGLGGVHGHDLGALAREAGAHLGRSDGDRKSTRLNSSHSQKSYAVFCLEKKKKSIYVAPY